MLNSLKPLTLALSLSLSAFAIAPAIAAKANHTVPWYLANPVARASILSSCNANPGDLSQNPDCVNAEAAQQYAVDSIL
jgi:hypothetical protein